MSHRAPNSPSQQALTAGLRLSRRTCLLTGAGLLSRSPAFALGRVPFGGTLVTAVPWSLQHLDPHELNDPIATFLGPPLFEPLFAADAQDRVYPTLAASHPQPDEHGGVLVKLRRLRWSNGSKVKASHVAWSLTRSRRLGAKALFAGVGTVDAVDDTTVRISGASSDTLAQTLCSPLTALLSPSSHPNAPVGCGPFRGVLKNGVLSLSRNPFAARGLSYLDAISVHPSPDMSDALRRFEAHQCNLGWFGRGLHEPRPGSRLVDAGHAGWVVLHSGKDSGAWSTPGAVSSMLATLTADSLARFGLQPSPTRARTASYQGPECTLVVRDDAPYLLELATTLSALLSTVRSPITVRRVPPKELKVLKRTRSFGFLLDQLRPLGHTPRSHQLSLLSEAGLDRHPPAMPPSVQLADVPALTTTNLNFGVVGSMRLLLATLPEFRGVERGNLGEVWQQPSS